MWENETIWLVTTVEPLNNGHSGGYIFEPLNMDTLGAYSFEPPINGHSGAYTVCLLWRGCPYLGGQMLHNSVGTGVKREVVVLSIKRGCT